MKPSFGSHVRYHKKFGPDRLSRFKVDWIHTDKQTDRQSIYIYRYLLCFLSSESEEYDEYSTQTESDASIGAQDILDTAEDILDTAEDILDTADLNAETSTEEFDSTDSFIFIPETTPGIF